MGESPGHHQMLIHQPQPQQRSRLGGGLRTTQGQIVEVQGGHIVRSTGRKDRHSKVCTAKGPRDRRVRLSAHTAIQFYDVQDRLGYDRPSKAVDWLMKNAKAAIDELAELPPWQPTSNPAPHGETSSKILNVGEQGGSSHFEFSGSGGGGGDGGGSSFLPPSLDSDAIADTIKSFFPMAANVSSSVVSTAPSSSAPIGFQNYPPDLLSRSNSQNQDLRLSLQSFQDPIFNHSNASHHQHQNPNAALFSGLDAVQMVNPWNASESSNGGGNVGGGGYIFNVHPNLGQSQFYTQREPLQSINQPFVRAWVDPIPDNPMHSVIHPSSVQSIGFASGSGFAGFRIPARIQGEEEHDGFSDKPSSASSGSHH